MRNAGSVMPSLRSSQSPISAVPVEDCGGDDRGAHCHLAAVLRRQAVGDGEEGRRQPDGIDHHEQRHQRGDGELDRHLDQHGRGRTGRLRAGQHGRRGACHTSFTMSARHAKGCK